MDAAVELNSACKGCRLGRTKCDMLQEGHFRTCSRCKRLGMQCVPEERRSSARSRLGPQSRALLTSGQPTPDDAMTRSILDPAGILDAGNVLEASLSSDGPPIGAGISKGDRAVANTFCSVINQGASKIDREVLEELVRIVVEVACARDHCGLMSYAMKRAHDLGLRLSTVLPTDARAKPCAVLHPPFELPPIVMELFGPGRLCYMRVMSDGKTWSVPNPSFAQWVASRGGNQEAFASFSPTKMIDLMESDHDRHRLLSLISQTLLAPLVPAGNGTLIAEVKGDAPIDMRFKEGEFESTYGRVRQAHQQRQATHPLRATLDESEDGGSGRFITNSLTTVPEYLVPHAVTLRQIRFSDATGGHSCFCVSYLPTAEVGSIGLSEADVACPTTVPRTDCAVVSSTSQMNPNPTPTRKRPRLERLDGALSEAGAKDAVRPASPAMVSLVEVEALVQGMEGRDNLSRTSSQQAPLTVSEVLALLLE